MCCVRLELPHTPVAPQPQPRSGLARALVLIGLEGLHRLRPRDCAASSPWSKATFTLQDTR